MFRFFKTIRDIKKLKKIEPDKAWLDNRRVYFANLSGESASARPAVRAFGRLRIASVLAVIILTVAAGGSAVSSAQAAMPNDFLYPVKLLSEQLRGLLVVGNENKVDFALKLAEKRLEEADSVATSTNEAVVVDAISRAHDKLEEAGAILSSASGSDDSKKGGFKKIENALKKLDKLAERKDRLTDRVTALKLPAALAALRKLDVASVNVEQEAGKIVITISTASSTATSTASEALLGILKERAEKAIKRAEEKIESVELRISSSTGEEADRAAEKLNEAREKLSDAKEELNASNFEQATRKANDAFRKAAGAEAELLEKSSNAKSGDDDDEDGGGKDDAKNQNNRGALQILKLLEKGAGKSGKVPPGLLRAPGIIKRLRGIFDFSGQATTTPTSTDTTAPVISAVHASEISTSSAKISWGTDEAADSVVNFGTSASYGMTVATTTFATNHSLVINNLTASTTYHFQAISKDGAGNEASSSGHTFTTSAAPQADAEPPLISSVSASNISSSSATISWTTNETTTGKIYYSPSSPADPQSTSTVSQIDAAQSLSHSIGLENLSASSTYYFFVEAKDASGNIATSTGHSFTTVGAE